MSTNSLGNAAGQSVGILAWQFCWLAAAAGIGAALYDARVGWSVLAGGGIGLLWTAYMAFTLFRHSLNHGARMSAATFVVAWLVKMIFTVGLLIVAFRSEAVAPLGLLAGLFAALLAYWVWLAAGFGQRKSAGTAGDGSGNKG